MHYINFFGLQFDVNPVAFTLPIGDGWNVYWYGIIITIGFVLAVIYGMKRAKSFGINPDNLLTATLVTAVCAILFGRAYYILFDANMDFTQYFKIHDGGMAIPGAIIGAVVIGALMCKLEKMDIRSTFDLMALGFLLGQGIGRWGNFINQEAYGTPTGSTWFGMSGDIIASGSGSAQLVHPCFLYESLWCLLGFLIFHFVSKHRKFKGEIACFYMVWYGVERGIVEGLRTDALMIGNARVTQWLCLAAAVVGAVLLVIGFVRAKSSNNDDSPKKYVPVFGELDENGIEVEPENIDTTEKDATSTENTEKEDTGEE